VYLYSLCLDFTRCPYQVQIPMPFQG